MLEGRCRWLQTAAESPFVQNAMVQRHLPQGLAAMRARTLKILTADGTTERQIESADDYVATLGETFGLDLPEAAELWSAICRRHEALFGSEISRKGG